MTSPDGLIERIGEKSVACEPPPDLETLLSPPFVPHRWIPGGHFQSVLSLNGLGLRPLHPHLHWVNLPDGDRLAMLDDCPKGWRPGDASLLVVHGLCGCSDSTYMLRFASRFLNQGVRVFRLNLRGCGVGLGAASQITHAGRSDDLVAAFDVIAKLTQRGPISGVGVSLGGNQLLRAMGLIGRAASSSRHFVSQHPWIHRIHRIAAVSPPIDLELCSNNMERRLMRPYNRFFIRYLLKRAPEALKNHAAVVEAVQRPPKTMRELDDRVTAPLGGFKNAIDYYQQTAASRVLGSVQVPTLILAATDDPIVPVSCFDHAARTQWSDSIRLVITRGGGHVGFIGRGEQRHWMDGLLARWFEFGKVR
jgi:predicted alpha/beta-fold hydrolase